MTNMFSSNATLAILNFPLREEPPKKCFFVRIRYHISHKISLSLLVIFGVRAGYRGEGWNISEKENDFFLKVTDEIQIKAVTFDN